MNKLGLFFLTGLMCLLSAELPAGPPAGEYAVANIPKDLLEGAQAVVRKDYTYIDVSSINRSTMKIHYVVTIMDERAEHYAVKGVSYDRKFFKPPAIEANLYDAQGKLIRKLKQKEIIDQSYVSSGSLYEDERIRGVVMKHTTYPYTVEFIYTQPMRDAILLNRWYAQGGEHEAVEQASLTISMPPELQLLYKKLHHEQEPAVSREKGKVVYHWAFSHLKPIEREPLGPGFSYFVPALLLTPADFQREKYIGSSRSWEDYGRFFYELNAGRDELPPEMEAKVLELCAGVEDPREKIRILYEYMQANTRYVSVQLGIGGWQTYDAEYVYKNGYGDCKALSNYMQSMLKKIGITSYAANIYASEQGSSFYTDFPSNQFNHRILCVPLEQDTVWLECTSSENPAGYLGAFTEDRPALLLTPEGGKLVRTPSTASENKQVRKVDVQLRTDGTAAVSVRILSYGQQQDDVSYVASNLSTQDQKDWLKARINVGSYDLKSHAFEELPPAAVPVWQTTYELEARQWAGVSGSRVFLKPNVLAWAGNIPPRVEQRTQPVVLSQPALYLDTVVYHLPPGYHIESQPEFPVRMEEEFGDYEANLEMIEPETLLYTRRLYVKRIVLPPSYYEIYREFMRAVRKADKLQLVLKGDT
ncbi:MAG: DUF3857 domain-containing protein [Bacteroidetes bacterium]|nr:MAG: DUF3857 domain-containing protein [Bacteroidota bacterium]